MIKSIETIKKEIVEIKNDLNKNFGIEKLAIFGSYSNNTATQESDIDIVILNMKQKNGFLIAKAKVFLSQKLELDVDLGLYDSIRPFIKRRIEKDLIYV